MATATVFGPVAPTPESRLSNSSSPVSPTTSSESPRTATSATFPFTIRGISPDPDDDVVPKIEELDDDDDIREGLIGADGEIPLSPRAITNGAIIKRPRGRPRKHPKQSPTILSKTPKGRSKTGCITCRRRKKKCDETKPACLHCQKNNVVCEGYPPKDFWQSGKQRMLKGRAASFDRPKELPILIEGIESDIDRFFFDHFIFDVSRVLTLFTDKQNPFKEILLPMATSHRGLMHSLLCLSGSHLASKEHDKQFEERQLYHFGRAIDNLRTDTNMAATLAGDQTAIIDDPTVAQTLVLCLKSICAGEVNGEYRPHLDAAKHLVFSQKSPNEGFQRFLYEFFLYHDVSNSVTSLDRTTVMMMEDFKLPEWMIQPEAGALLGVVDGLFGIISKIRGLRDRIRTRRKQGLSPGVDYQLYSDACAIDARLRSWVCNQGNDENRYYASLLYRQSTWLYLYRTICKSAPDPRIHAAVEEGLVYLRKLPQDAPTQSILLMPVFILGCAAFDHEQRPEIRQAFDGLEQYSRLGNIQYARKVVEKVWEMMDAGDEDSWDWETILSDMGWDFLIT